MSINTLALAEESVGPDEAAVVAQFVEFLKATSKKHHPTGTVPRFNQGRAAGCVDAELVVPDGLPQDLRVGLFAEPWTYKARIRFANATSLSDKERDVRGMSIKVPGAGGENLTAGVTDHDFVLNSHPVMMVGNTKTFLDLLKAVEVGAPVKRCSSSRIRSPRPWHWHRGSMPRVISRFLTGARLRTCSAQGERSSTACVRPPTAPRRCPIR